MTLLSMGGDNFRFVWLGMFKCVSWSIMLFVVFLV